MKYFTDPRPFEPERIKAIRIQWTRCLLRVKRNMHVYCTIKILMSNNNDKVNVLQIRTNLLIIPFKKLSGLLCKKQNQTTTLSLGHITTSCQCPLH